MTHLKNNLKNAITPLGINWNFHSPKGAIWHANTVIAALVATFRARD